MKKITFTLMIALTALIVFISGCKKEKSSAQKKFALSNVSDTSGTDLFDFVYDSNGNLTRINNSGTEYDFYFANGKVAKRTTSSSGTLQSIDSFFYDPSGQLIRAEDYDNTLSKVNSTYFAYNGDGTLNTASIDYVSSSSPDELYEFTYSGGKLTQRNFSIVSSGSYKLFRKVELLGYDDKANPWMPISTTYLYDFFSGSVFIWSGPNNVTSAKETDYDLTTGNPVSISLAEFTYHYNSDALPDTMLAINGGGISYRYIAQ